MFLYVTAFTRKPNTCRYQSDKPAHLRFTILLIYYNVFSSLEAKSTLCVDSITTNQHSLQKIKIISTILFKTENVFND